MLCDYWSESIDSDELEDEEETVLTPDCCDVEEWDFVIECLADGILWDRDFEMDDLFVDEAPEKAAFLKSYMGIEDDYFTAVACDPSDAGLHRVKRTLQRLTKPKPR